MTFFPFEDGLGQLAVDVAFAVVEDGFEGGRGG
jgi:hypothetical protein